MRQRFNTPTRKYEDIAVTFEKSSKGFTLLELIVTIAVVGIIVSFGVPSFISMIQSNRATTDTNDLVTALNLGRNEATRRAAGITVCSSADGVTCSGENDWSTGWIVRSDAGDVLRAWPERNEDAGVVTGNVSQVRFLARGSLAGGAPLVQISCAADERRDVRVNVAGRISVNRVVCP